MSTPRFTAAELREWINEKLIADRAYYGAHERTERMLRQAAEDAERIETLETAQGKLIAWFRQAPSPFVADFSGLAFCDCCDLMMPMDKTPEGHFTLPAHPDNGCLWFALRALLQPVTREGEPALDATPTTKGAS